MLLILESLFFFGQFLDSLFDASRISKVDSSKLGGRFALGDCEDKLLISCLDIDENVLSSKAAGVIKRATGEEKDIQRSEI